MIILMTVSIEDEGIFNFGGSIYITVFHTAPAS